MRRLTAPLVATVLVLAVALAAYQFLFGGDSAAALVLSQVDGQVLVASGDAPAQAAEAGVALSMDDQVSTAAGSSAVLTLGEATRISLDGGTSLRVDQVDPEGVRLELEEGVLQATVRPGSGALSVDAGGRSALATDGDFTVGRRGDVAAVEVSRGQVALTGFPGVDTLGADQRVEVVGESQAMVLDNMGELLLDVSWPEEARTRGELVQVQGRTAAGAEVLVRSADAEVSARADDKGQFFAEVRLVEGDNRLEVIAVDVFGKAVTVEHSVIRDSQGPAFTGGVEYKR